jgi:hypothetical protein
MNDNICLIGEAIANRNVKSPRLARIASQELASFPN